MYHTLGIKLLSPLCVQILKTLVVALLVAGVIPLLLGLLFELVIVAPLRVPLDQTPLFYPWQVCCSTLPLRTYKK